MFRVLDDLNFTIPSEITDEDVWFNTSRLKLTMRQILLIILISSPALISSFIFLKIGWIAAAALTLIFSLIFAVLSVVYKWPKSNYRHGGMCLYQIIGNYLYHQLPFCRLLYAKNADLENR